MTRAAPLWLCLALASCVVTVGEEDAGPGTRASSIGATSGAASGTTTASAAASASATSGSASGSAAGGSTSGGPAPYCGDGIVQPDAGEVCDLGANNGKGLGCNETCNLLGLVTTIAGNSDGGRVDGIGPQAAFFLPYGVAVLDGFVYVADTYYRAVRQVNPATGQVITIAGGNTGCSDENGVGDAGTFCDLNGILAYDGGLIVTDDSALRFVTPGGVVTTFAGQLAESGTPSTGVDAGPFASTLYGVPQGITELSGIVYTDSKLDGYVVASDPATQLTSVLAVIQSSSALQLGGMTALNDLLFTSDESQAGGLVAIDLDGGYSAATGASLVSPNGLCNDGRSIYICESGANDIKQYDPLNGTVTLLAGSGQPHEVNGLGIQASFDSPAGCAYDPGLNRLYVTDKFGNTLRMIQ